jgi:hypothetical protein
VVDRYPEASEYERCQQEGFDHGVPADRHNDDIAFTHRGRGVGP